ncbi:MAG: GNAT family N-acetyltransferase [Thermoplasmata archaeon]
MVGLRDGRSALIRRATAEDAGPITDLVNLVGGEGRFVLRERATWTLDQERATLAAASGPQSAFFVAEVSGRLSGLLNVARGAWLKDAHVAEFGMSCLPDCRGVGLGTALLSAGIEWARSVGVHKLTLEVFATNERAVALYRKRGFVEEARLQGQYVIDGAPVDSLLMALWL